MDIVNTVVQEWQTKAFRRLNSYQCEGKILGEISFIVYT